MQAVKFQMIQLDYFCSKLHNGQKWKEEETLKCSMLIWCEFGCVNVEVGCRYVGLKGRVCGEGIKLCFLWSEREELVF
jgi:hypothetical protein